MKPKFFLFLLVLLNIFTACSIERNDSFKGDMSSSQNADSVKEIVAYPKCHKSVTRSNVLSSGWETWERVTLASGETPFTPWNPTCSGTSIPYEVRMDIQPKDGWELIAHTVNGYGERGMNYLIFHNHYTGILKVFYYLESYSSSLQNTAMWKLHFENPQSFLAFTDEYARLSTDKSVRDIYLSNITNDDSRGYTAGWNCF